MKRRHPRRLRSEWVEIIEQQSQSGLTVRAFCEQNDVGLASFVKWKQQLTTKPQANTAGSMFEPIVINNSQSNRSPRMDTTCITLNLGPNITLTIQTNGLDVS